MNWIDKLERKFGRFAIQNLMLYIIATHAIILILSVMQPAAGQLLISKLVLVPRLVLRGEIWRLITFIFIPHSLSPLWGIFALFFYYSISNSLESQWGSFKFNLYYFIGMLGTIIASMVFKINGTPGYLHLTLFLAYAKLYGESQIYLFMILPIKIKYLAYVYWAITVINMVFGGLTSLVLISVSLGNYFLFFGKDNVRSVKTKQQVTHRRREFKKDRPTVISMHKCAVCGLSDREDPNMDFRYCPDCEGHFAYCTEHIRNHEHK